VTGRIVALAVLLALVAAPSAQAVPDCSPLPVRKTILSGQPILESIIADARGRLFYTDSSNNRLMRLDGPGAEPKVLTSGFSGSGGLAWNLDGSLVLGFNGGQANSVADGTDGGLLRVDPETGKSSEITRGMGQANGLVRGPDGAIYASNDFGNGIDRVFQGKVQDDWSKVETPNGLVIDTAGRYLYAAQTFKPASIAKIDLADPSKQTSFFDATGPDLPAGPDGMTRDDRDRLFLAVNGIGEVWRIDTDGTACALARGIQNASALNWGGDGGGFPSRNLYVVAFSGVLIELADATDKPPAAGPPVAAEHPSLSMTVTPTAVSRRTPSRFRFRVLTAAAGGGTQPVPGATVRLGNKRATTNAAGKATIRVSFFHTGRKSVRALLAGYRSAATKIRVK
jgi:sugar lactone lactonase YvrE